MKKFLIGLMSIIVILSSGAKAMATGVEESQEENGITTESNSETIGEEGEIENGNQNPVIDSSGAQDPLLIDSGGKSGLENGVPYNIVDISLVVPNSMKEEGEKGFVHFINTETYEEFEFTLNPETEYVIKGKLPYGNYTISNGGVIGDNLLRYVIDRNLIFAVDGNVGPVLSIIIEEDESVAGLSNSQKEKAQETKEEKETDLKIPQEDTQAIENAENVVKTEEEVELISTSLEDKEDQVSIFQGIINFILSNLSYLVMLGALGIFLSVRKMVVSNNEDDE